MATPEDYDETSGNERAVMTGRVGLGRLGLGRLGAVGTPEATGIHVVQEDVTPDTPSTWTEVDL